MNECNDFLRVFMKTLRLVQGRHDRSVRLRRMPAHLMCNKLMNHGMDEAHFFLPYGYVVQIDSYKFLQVV